jgi:uncharacterized protein (TIGR03083 family)
MEIDEHIAALEIEGRRFVDAATGAGFTAPVPSCPDWTVRDLTVHQGSVHRWAAKVVSEKLQSGADAPIGAIMAAAPDDSGLAEWFVAGHAALLDALRNGSPDDDFWRFMRNAPSSLAFWARRQSHETSIHRVDADLARAGASPTFDPAFAADGVDELLLGFGPRKKLVMQPAITLLLEATDAERQWFTTLGDGVTAVTEGIDPDAAQASVSGPADAIYRFVWNRLDASGPELVVGGDPDVVETWRTAMAVV